MLRLCGVVSYVGFIILLENLLIALLKKIAPGGLAPYYLYIPELHDMNIELSNLFDIRVGSSSNILFSLEKWLHGITLASRFPCFMILIRVRGASFQKGLAPTMSTGF